MGTNDFKYNNVPLIARKPGNINTSMSASSGSFASKRLLPRIPGQSTMYVPSFIKIERGSHGDP